MHLQQKTANERSASHILHTLRTNFDYYAPRALKVLPKGTSVVPFVMNKSQQFVHDHLEDQMARKGRIRALVVKGRQQGMSTYAEGRLIWKVTMNQAIRAFVVASESKNTSNLFQMSKRYYNYLPDALKPALGACNGYEMQFPGLESGIRIASAGSEEVGRGLTITHLHGSEVAYWDNGAAIIASLFQAVPDLPNTEIILESTAAGPVGIFHKLVSDARAGINEYEVIFCPWFWEDAYRLAVPEGFELSQEELDYMNRFDLDTEQMVWRRNKIATSEEGLVTFQREYPATIDEAFEASIEGALWTRDMINAISDADFAKVQAEYELEETVIAFDPAGSSANEKNDESGFIAACRMSNGNVYVLEDASGHYPDQKMIPSLADLYHKHDADRIIIETNGVGDWVPTMVNKEDPSIVVRKVRAIKGKRLRAEPVAQQYSQKKVFHVRARNRNFEKLEAEMCTWKQGGKSPNRVDALVYAITDLMCLGERKKFTPIMWSRG